MFSRINALVGRVVISGLMVGGIGLGLLGGVGAAHAQDNQIVIGNGRPCTWEGVSYPEGTYKEIAGMKFICLSGAWVETIDTLTLSGATGGDQGTPPVATPVKPIRNLSHSADSGRSQ